MKWIGFNNFEIAPLPKHKVFTLSQLTIEYEKLNMTKFNRKIKCDIKLRKMRCCNGRVRFKPYYGNNKKIFIKYTITLNKDMERYDVINTLLHEMCHIEMHYKYGNPAGHTKGFWNMFIQKGGQFTKDNINLYSRAKTIADKIYKNK